MLGPDETRLAPAKTVDAPQVFHRGSDCGPLEGDADWPDERDLLGHRCARAHPLCVHIPDASRACDHHAPHNDGCAESRDYESGRSHDYSGGFAGHGYEHFHDLMGFLLTLRGDPLGSGRQGGGQDVIITVSRA